MSRSKLCSDAGEKHISRRSAGGWVAAMVGNRRRQGRREGGWTVDEDLNSASMSRSEHGRSWGAATVGNRRRKGRREGGRWL
ncbi:hypothetical protein Hanom_Chr09g00836941 [Helianthus anomalus]